MIHVSLLGKKGNPKKDKNIALINNILGCIKRPICYMKYIEMNLQII